MTNSPSARRLLPIAVGAVVLLAAPSPAHAQHWVRWCAQFAVQYSDSGIGEDYWPETWDDTEKPLYGAYFVLRDEDNVLYGEGYLYDGVNGGGEGTAGCTMYIPMPSGNYNFWVYSNARVRGNTIDARDTYGFSKVMAVYGVPVTISTRKDITFAPPLYGTTWDVFNVEQAAAWALHGEAAGLGGKTYYIEVGDPTGCDGGGACNSGGVIYIDNFRNNRKFRIVHEVGHRLSHHRGIANASDYTYTGQGSPIDPDCGADGTPDGWAPQTLEWVGAAVHEGFADFYSAVAWNDADEEDCWLSWTGNFLDCEGDLTHELAWVDDNTCRTPDDPESGAAVDWVRIFWDVHTNGPEPDPTFTYIARDWMDQAGNWQRDTAFTVLNNRAAVLGGDLFDNWLDAVGDHAPYYWY